MALGFTENSNTFLDDHRPYYTVNYWNTVYTPESEGIEFSLFTLINGVLFEDTVGQVPTSKTQAVMEATLNNKAMMTSVLGYTGTPHNTGVTPNVYHHWGAGALPGVTKVKATVLKFKGFVKNTGTVTMAFGGQGRVQVFKQGVEIGFGRMKEPDVSPDLQSLTTFQDEGGYYFIVDESFTAGDEVEIFYWHHGQDWGGVFCKLIDSSTPFTYNKDTVRQVLRDAPVLGASFMGIEAGGGDLASTELPYIQDISIDYNRDSLTTAVINVALTTIDQPTGFHWDEVSRTLTDNDTDTEFKEERRIEIVAGYAKPRDLKDASGNIAAAEAFSRFTGHITKIQLASDFQTAEIHCKDFAGKMMQTFDENFPDRLSYHANGYILREGGHEPMYPIPAFDAWPIETAIHEYCNRSGVDAKYLGKDPLSVDPDFGRRDAFTVTSQEQRFLRRLLHARYLGDDTSLIPLENNSAYGNVGVLKKDFLPDDDEYLYPPEITRRCYDQAVEKAEHYGYNFSFDPLGRVYLRAGNNPDEFWSVEAITANDADASPQLLVGTGTNMTLPTDRSKEASAIGGTYMAQTTLDAFTITVEGYFSRLDLYAGIGLSALSTNNGGVIDFSIEIWNGATYDAPSITGSISTYFDGEEAHFYDGVLRTDGTNATVFPIFQGNFERYRVTLIDGGIDAADTGTADFRLNGISVFYQDPGSNMFPVSFGTDTNVFSMAPASSKEDLRNHVIVVGRRKGVLTDSAKLSGSNTNPNNLDHEFNVAVAADPASIYDKGSVNFTGNKRIAVIYDDKISDSDFARWVALTTLFRYRDPKYKIPLETIAIPMLELGDAMLVHEAAQDTVNTVVWVQQFTETWKPDEATVSVTTSSYPDIPSFQPQLTPDVDGLFGGQPANNLRISYTNLMGDSTPLGNTDLDDPTMIKGIDNTVAMMVTSQVFTTTLMPETLWLRGNTGDISLAQTRAHINHPYRHFYHIASWSGAHFPTITWDVQEGDGDTASYGAAYYDMDTPTTGNVTWDLLYKSFAPRTGSNPFYDPYSSELGHLISVKFDAITSGRYRVSVWDARRSGGIETPVAWLTNPQGDPTDPHDHWLYLDPQRNVEFTWDGVDNIGIWNRRQSADYAQRLSGSFGEEPLAVGAGFYAWNDLSTDLLTQIGDDVPENYRTSTDIRESGFPYYTSGKYSQFYIKIETLNPVLMQIDAALGIPLGTPRVVSSDGGLNTVDAGHETSEVYVWSHLGEPSQIDISVKDWDPDNNQLLGEWTPGDNSDFGTLLDASNHPAIIRNGKPVKYSFSPRARAGALFSDDPNLTNAQLTRQIHLQATIFDQFWTFFGSVWEGISAENVHTLKKRLTSRMFHNNNHTKELKDSTFRSGTEISAFEWIFQPEFFKLDFGLGLEESLRYGDYEQLEALPGHNPRGVFGQDQAFITLAFMNYLFYFSAYSMDRSGRKQWMLNREFIDKSKIVTPDWLAATFAAGPNQHVEYAVDHASRSATEYLKRSIFTREWRDDDWKVNNAGDVNATRTPLSPHNTTHPGTGGALDADEHKWLQFPITHLEPQNVTTLIMSPGDTPSHNDKWMQAYRGIATEVNSIMRRNNSLDSTGPTLPTVPLSSDILPERFGDWTFEVGNQGSTVWYQPSPKRDFHPYWNVSMSNWHTPYMIYWDSTDASDAPLGGNWIGASLTNLPHHSLFMIPSSHIVHRLRDPKGQENWFGYAFQHAETESRGDPFDLRGARLEQSVAGWAEEEKQDDLAFAFDYVRQDTLARYEHFRGVWSRGPFGVREKLLASWEDSGSSRTGRAGTTQRVSPSGLYFLNMGRYKDFVVGSPQEVDKGDRQHWTRGINDWYYIRFRHEYVWYSDRHFPVGSAGTALYEFMAQEYTQMHITQSPWAFVGAEADTSKVFFDTGAWVGFKDDVTDADDIHVLGWTNAPILRWGEANFRGGIGIKNSTGTGTLLSPLGVFQQGATSTAYSSGGYKYFDTDGSPNNLGLDQSGVGDYTDYWFRNEEIFWTARNIFDMGNREWGTMRLAVGPELDQSREIHMNLVLPTNLKT